MEKNEETQFSKLMIDGTPEERVVLRKAFIEKIAAEHEVEVTEAIYDLLNDVMVESFEVTVDHYQAVMDNLRNNQDVADKIAAANSLRLAKLELNMADPTDIN